MNFFQTRDWSKIGSIHYSNKFQDCGNHDELTSEIAVMLHRFCGRTKFNNVGTNKEFSYISGMIRKTSILEVTWLVSFHAYIHVLLNYMPIETIDDAV